MSAVSSGDQWNTSSPNSNRWPSGAPRNVFTRLSPRTIRGTLLSLLLIVVVPVLLAQVVMFYSEFETRRSQEVKANLELARAVSSIFDSYIRDLILYESSLGLSIESSLQPERVKALIIQSAREYPAIERFSWVDPQGRTVADSRHDAVGVDISDRLDFKEIVNGREWFVSHLQQAIVGGEPRFFVARGIRDDNGSLKGVVSAVVDPTRLGEVLKVQRVGRAAIGINDSGGRLVYRFPEMELSWEDRNLIADDAELSRALSGAEVSGVFVWPVDRREYIRARVPLSSVGWVVSSGRPVDEVLGPVVIVLFRSFVFIVFVAAVSFAIAMMMSRNITTPVRRLRKHMKALPEGGLGHPVEVNGPVELVELGDSFNRMAEAMEVKTRAIAQERERLEAIIRNTSDGIVLIDGQRRVMSMNPALEALTGWTTEDVKGRPCCEVFRSRDQHGISLCETACPVLRTMSSGVPVPYAEVTITTRDGRSRDLSVSYVYISPPSSPDGYCVAIGRDISVMKEVEKLKDEFVSLLSHDLRTPLTIIRGQAQMVQRYSDRLDVVRSSSDAIIDSGRRMEAMIADLVDSARLETGQLRIERQSVDLMGFTSAMLERAGPMVEVGRILLEMPSDLPPINADPDRLERVLMNLLTNALKYSPPEASVLVSARRLGGEVAVSVTDHGVGIAREDLPRIFERYFRADTMRRADGLGLGLYISKMLVNAHGGQVWAESEPGRGSTFYFTLPFAADTPDADASRMPESKN
ncbi:MAG: PAS domain S-box protein [Chloroflexi bacterium]|nr:PAS domain S-box protein [Chloroflexota bacterium]